MPDDHDPTNTPDALDSLIDNLREEERGPTWKETAILAMHLAKTLAQRIDELHERHGYTVPLREAREGDVVPFTATSKDGGSQDAN